MAGGVLLAAALVHLLPDAQEGLQEVSIALHQSVRPSAVPRPHEKHSIKHRIDMLCVLYRSTT